MSVEGFGVYRKLICATCLSQNRTLYPIKDSNPFAVLNLDIALTEEDHICWECRHIVMKINAFKNQAQTAQATLTALSNGNKCEVESLSRLSQSSQISVVANNSSDDEDVKSEEDDKNDVIQDMFGEEHDERFQHEDEDKYMEAEDSCDTNKTKPKLESKETKRSKNKVDNKLDSICSVKKITKYKMQQWRERKKDMDFYTDSVFKCMKCIEPLKSATLYRAHKKRHTKVYGKVVCRICKLRFVDGAALNLHSETHFRLLTCNICAHEWDSANSMRRHCSEAHDVPVTTWTCDLCPREFRSPQKLSAHTRCHRLHSCPECGLSLRSSLKKHMDRQHPELPLRCCLVCNQQFKGDSRLKMHMEKHCSKVEDATFCKECNMEFRNKYVYRSHMRNTVRHAAAKDLRFKCKECGKGFLDNFALTNHMDAMHDKRMKYECESCGEGFRTVVARRKHVRRQHEGKLPPKDKICDYCGKAFQTKAFLLQHINSHTGARPYKCKICDSSFGYKSALYLHGRFVHKISKKA